MGKSLPRRSFVGGVMAGAVVAGMASGVSTAAASDTETETDTGTETDAADVNAAAAECTLLHDRMADDAAWADFLDQQDLLWNHIPTKWFEGPFLGNGRLGVMAFQPAPDTPLQILVGHSEVQDHRPELGPIFGLARLPVGHLLLETVGTVTGVSWRLDVWNAELTGTVTTTAGSLRLRMLVHDQRSVLVATLTPDAGERAFQWTFAPEPAVSPRADPRWKKPIPAGYTGNPPAQLTNDGPIDLAVQPMTAGGQTVTAWQQSTHGDDQTLLLSVAHSFPDNSARDTAIRAVRNALRTDSNELSDELIETHRHAWHAFYRKSFLSLPDPRFQSFFWIQLYKLNSATRGDAPIMATTGPWVTPTLWPAVWWDANVQTEYWLIQSTNHQEMDSVSTTFAKPVVQRNLIDQVPEPYRSDSAGIWRESDMFGASGGVLFEPGTTPHPPWETTSGMEIGDLTWALHTVWSTYSRTLDSHLLRGTLFPLLRRSVNYYLHFLQEGADGLLHLPATYYPESDYETDCPYDATLLLWGCQTLLDLASKLGVRDPLEPRWRQVLQRLAGKPQTNLAVYPLQILNWDQPESRPFINSFVDGWQTNASDWNGFYHAWVGSIAAQAGRGDDALGILQHLLDTMIKPSTMYAEAKIAPVIESPLAAANTLADLVLQSWGGIIRVFPSMPAAWPDAVFHDFRAEGAFLVSARRQGGVSQFVRVLSLAGEPCLVRTGIPGRLAVRSSFGRRPKVTQVDAQTVRIDIRRDEEVVVWAANTDPDLTIEPVAAVGTFRWGLT